MKTGKSGPRGKPQDAEARRLLHELQVHQVELEQQNEELREARGAAEAAIAKYTDLYDSAPVGYVTVSELGLVLEANLTAAALFGVARGALFGQPAALYVSREDVGVYDRLLQQIAATGEPQAWEARMVRADGTVFWAHLAATATAGPGGGRVCRIALSDITARKRDEAELHNALTLQRVGTLAGGIAHDFNNLLQRVFGNLSLAMAELPEDHPCHATLAAAAKAKDHAQWLTRQLLTFAKGGAPVKERVSLGTMVEEVARFHLSGSSVGLAYRQAGDLWPVLADSGQLQQVVANLVVNAREAMPEGGHLHIALENARLAARAVPTLRAGRYVRLTVRDEGPGIAPEALRQVFDPYYTTKAAGDGLGLATVWSIVNRHGGHVGVASEKGRGATFTLYLPAAEGPAPAEAKAEEAEYPAPERPVRVLVMDDEEDVLVLAARMLRRGGYLVATAPGGEEAIARYREALAAGEPFDAVIMDLTIPGGMGGKEAVKALLALDPRARVIVSSGYAEDPALADPAACGFKGAVPKPYSQRELCAAVGRVAAGC